jgi:hypothetical protein
MHDANSGTHRKRNERVTITDDERRVIEALRQSSEEQRHAVEAGLQAPDLHDLTAEMARDTRSLLARAIPDFDKQANDFVERHGPRVADLKGRSPGGQQLMGSHGHILEKAGSLKTSITPIWFEWLKDPNFLQPPFAGEFWWAQTDWFTSGAAAPLSVYIDGDPYCIWGHIGYGGDRPIGGAVGITATYILGSDRIPISNKTNFELRPVIRTVGNISGWTGLYHPLWHADDKWSKCWRLLRVTLSLSTGETLDEEIYPYPLFELANETPVGQGSSRLFGQWEPILRFNLNTLDLRLRGVSLILTAEVRFDVQLEGESDIWFRDHGGSAQESVPSLDNSVAVRFGPGYLIPVP